MPNWCYNYTELEIDDNYYYQIETILNSININNLKLPEDICTKINNTLFDYDPNQPENYLSKFVEDVNQEIELGGNNDDTAFDYTSKWSPSDKILKSYSEDYPLVLITNSYDSTGDDYAGKDVILNGKYLEEESWKLSEKNWEEYGEGIGEVIIKLLLADDFVFRYSNGEEITFNCKQDIIDFYQKNEDDDPFDLLAEEFDLYGLTNDWDLENCEEQIQEAFEGILFENNE